MAEEDFYRLCWRREIVPVFILLVHLRSLETFLELTPVVETGPPYNVRWPAAPPSPIFSLSAYPTPRTAVVSVHQEVSVT